MNNSSEQFGCTVFALGREGTSVVIADISEWDNPDGGLSLVTYSNSNSTVFTYISIFETLWAQTE
jgi:hypothetical protein